MDEEWGFQSGASGGSRAASFVSDEVCESEFGERYRDERGGESELRLLVLPSWLHEVQPTHTLWWNGGIACCKDCGGMVATTPTVGKCLLRVKCKKHIATGSAGRAKRFFAGLLPHGWTSWPDGRYSSVAWRPPARLVWDHGAQQYSLSISTGTSGAGANAGR